MGNKKPTATKSFDQMISQSNRDALKPFIMQQMQLLGQQLNMNLLKSLEPVQLRIMVLEKILAEKLGISEDEIMKRVSDEEDAATGFAISSEPLKKGDTLRAELKVKRKGEKEFTPPSKDRISNVAVEPYTVSKEFEEGLLGMVVGDVKETKVDESEVILKVERISSPINPPKQETVTSPPPPTAKPPANVKKEESNG